MPEKHRRMGDWTPDRFIGWAEKIGPNTAALTTAVTVCSPTSRRVATLRPPRFAGLTALTPVARTVLAGLPDSPTETLSEEGPGI